MAAPSPDTRDHPVRQPVGLGPIQLSRRPITTTASLEPTVISSVEVVLFAHLVPRV